MPTICEVRGQAVRIPLTTEFKTSSKTTTSMPMLTVNVRTDDGVDGWGEAPLNPTFTDETAASARAAIDSVAGDLTGRDVEDLAVRLVLLHDRLARRNASRCALSMALWDLRGRLLGVPLYELLGGAHRTAVPVAYHLGHFDEVRDAEDARTAVDEGFGILKLKVGRPNVADDLRAVERVRAAVGDRARIYVDANQAWGYSQARAFVEHVRGLGVEFVEQPVPHWDLDGLSRLGATAGLTVAADESVYDAARLLATLTTARPGGVVVKLLKAGGIEGGRALLDLARLSRTPPLLAGMCGDSSIGSAALLHVAVATDWLPFGTAITPHFSREDLVVHPMRVVDGQLRLKAVDAPGLGVTVDRSQVERTAIREF